jgi:putative hydroxymethylpyrimidine transport system permease protein
VKGRFAWARPGNVWRYVAKTLVESWPAFFLMGVVVVIWELFLVVTGMPKYILPPLHKIFAVAVYKAPDVFLPAALVTAQEILLGFFFGVASGFLMGVAIFHVNFLRRGLLPIVVASQAVPVIAIAPILIIWFGFGLAPKVIVAALICFFPVTINTMVGFASVEPDALNLMHSLDATGWQIFWKVRFPAALPNIFAGMRNTAAISAIGAVVGEWVGADKGLAPVIIAANSAFLTEDIFAAILYLAAMAIALFLATIVAERVAIPWYFVSRRRQA